ncbi:MAG: hypothetical protein WC565_05915 [Parcubacteria group bacterium]
MFIAPGATDVTTYFVLVDPASGVPETGLTITDLDATYTRDKAAASKADLTACAAVDAAHSDNTAIQVDATNAPGLYRVDWPDAAFATGVARVQLCVNGAAISPAHLEVELVPWLTPITGATVRAVNSADAGLAVASTALDKTTWTDARAGYIDKAQYLPAVAAGSAGGVFIAGANAATSVTTALTANITGNLSGSVGSVTGAVGSVTGAVGSVTGAVGSVTGAVGSVTGAVGSVGAGGIAAASFAADAIAAAAVSAAAVTKIQTGLATPTNITAGTITTVSGNVTGSVGSVVGAVGSVTGLTAADVGTIKTRVVLALPAYAPDTSGGLMTQGSDHFQTQAVLVGGYKAWTGTQWIKSQIISDVMPVGQGGLTTITPGGNGWPNWVGMVLFCGGLYDAYRIISATDTTITLDHALNVGNESQPWFVLPYYDDLAARTATVTNLNAAITTRAATGEAAAAVGTLNDFDPASDAVANVTTVATVTNPVTAGTVSDKTGYALSATGLDSITATTPTGVATTFPQKLVQLWHRFFGKVTMTSTQLKTYDDAGTGTLTTQTLADDGTTQTQGKAS